MAYSFLSALPSCVLRTTRRDRLVLPHVARRPQGSLSSVVRAMVLNHRSRAQSPQGVLLIVRSCHHNETAFPFCRTCCLRVAGGGHGAVALSGCAAHKVCAAFAASSRAAPVHVRHAGLQPPGRPSVAEPVLHWHIPCNPRGTPAFQEQPADIAQLSPCGKGTLRAPLAQWSERWSYEP